MDRETHNVLRDMLAARQVLAMKYGRRAELDMLEAEFAVLDACKVVEPKKKSKKKKK